MQLHLVPAGSRWRSHAIVVKDGSTWGNLASMKYKVALKRSREGYSVSCPGLPGCWSQGRTKQEALENIQSAIREYLEAVDKISKGQA
jgi:predicted RNase H-like HicB family nuclease